MTTKALFAVAMLAAAANPAYAGGIQCITPLDISGTAARMQARDFSTIVWLKNAPLSPHSIAYGPGRQPNAEITAVDGRYHVTRAENGSINSVVNPGEQGAAMLVRASPAAWMDGGRLANVTGLASLSAALSARVKALGCAGDVTMPFRITARAHSLTWSVDGTPDTAKGTITDTDVIIVGVYSNHHQADSFMAAGLDLHAHMLVPASGMSGHVGAVVLADGSALQLASTN